ncbi:MAG: carboxymuconolactone decarboxylase family protein [Promethearchaeota archaeon]
MSNQEGEVIRKIERRKHVRLSKPRIPPLERDDFVKVRVKASEVLKTAMNKSEWEKFVEGLIEMTKPLIPFLGGNIEDAPKNLPIIDVDATIGQYEDLYVRLNTLKWHTGTFTSLSQRDKEILILRIGWLCHSKYEWGWHAFSAKAGGHLSDDEINRIMEGPDAESWDPFDATLLHAVDELYKDAFITDQTWNALAERYNTHQLMDLVFTVGFYNMLAMALNSFGVQLEEGHKIIAEKLGIPKIN